LRYGYKETEIRRGLFLRTWRSEQEKGGGEITLYSCEKKNRKEITSREKEKYRKLRPLTELKKRCSQTPRVYMPGERGESVGSKVNGESINWEVACMRITLYSKKTENARWPEYSEGKTLREPEGKILHELGHRGIPAARRKLTRNRSRIR